MTSSSVSVNVTSELKDNFPAGSHSFLAVTACSSCEAKPRWKMSFNLSSELKVSPASSRRAWAYCLADSFRFCLRDNISSNETDFLWPRLSMQVAMSFSFRSMYPFTWSVYRSTGEIFRIALSESSLMVSLAQSSVEVGF